MNAAIYLRVSSSNGRQDEANQEPDCVRLCAARGWEPMVFRERESAAKKRSVWDGLLESARIGETKTIVVWSLDRIGRSRLQVAHDLAQLGRWGVQVVSVRDAWLDVPSGPIRDLLIQVMAWFAEGERANLIKRTIAGLERARAKGVRLGRPPADPFKLYACMRRIEKGASVATAARLGGIPERTLRKYLAKIPPTGDGGLPLGTAIADRL